MNAQSPEDYQTISCEVRERVAWITLNRPDVLNAINPQMQGELAHLWQVIRYRDDVHVVVLTGSGDRAFTTGADREMMHSAGTPEDQSMRALALGRVPGGPGFESKIGELIAPKSQMCMKPVISAVNGMACGGAFYILGESDIIIAAEHATFFDPHVSFGMVSGYESIHMLQRMPMGELLRMQLLGNYERMTAQRAHQIGFVSEVVPKGELLSAAEWIASRIASLSPGAVQGTLRAIWAAVELPRAVALNLSPHFLAMANTADWAEGQSRFESREKAKARLR